jgi:hypothetical protein
MAYCCTKCIEKHGLMTRRIGFTTHGSCELSRDGEEHGWFLTWVIPSQVPRLKEDGDGFMSRADVVEYTMALVERRQQAAEQGTELDPWLLPGEYEIVTRYDYDDERPYSQATIYYVDGLGGEHRAIVVRAGKDDLDLSHMIKEREDGRWGIPCFLNELRPVIWAEGTSR